MTTGIREKKKRKTRQAILLAAITLFREKGYEQTTVEELARISGVGKGTIYGYFQTKSDILRALCEDKLERLHEQLTTSADKGIPLLQQMVSIYMCEYKLVTQSREFARLFMQQIVFPHEADREKHLANEDNYFRLLCPLFKKAQERGELRKDLYPFHIAGHFHGLNLLLVSAWLGGRVRTEEAEKVMETMFRQALEGMQPQSEPIATGKTR